MMRLFAREILLALSIVNTAWALPEWPHDTRDLSNHEGSFFYKGFDLSSLKIMEDGGAVYKDSQHGNITRPVEDILTGMNVIRLRLWVDPKIPYDGGCMLKAPNQWQTSSDSRRLRNIQPKICHGSCETLPLEGLPHISGLS